MQTGRSGVSSLKPRYLAGPDWEDLSTGRRGEKDEDRQPARPGHQPWAAKPPSPPAEAGGVLPTWRGRRGHTGLWWESSPSARSVRAHLTPWGDWRAGSTASDLLPHSNWRYVKATVRLPGLRAHLGHWLRWPWLFGSLPDQVWYWQGEDSRAEIQSVLV